MRKLSHQTLGAQKYAVSAEDYYDFKPGDRVIADGFPGKVTSVADGPFPGTESYEVTLDNGGGGGSYRAGQLSRAETTTAAHDGNQYDDGVGGDSADDLNPIEAGIKTSRADFWYPELGGILEERLPNENIRVYAGLRSTADLDPGNPASPLFPGNPANPSGQHAHDIAQWVTGHPTADAIIGGVAGAGMAAAAVPYLRDMGHTYHTQGRALAEHHVKNGLPYDPSAAHEHLQQPSGHGPFETYYRHRFNQGYNEGFGRREAALDTITETLFKAAVMAYEAGGRGLQEPIDETDDAPAPYGATHGTADPDELTTKLMESEENAEPGDSSEQPDTCSWCGGTEFTDFQDTGRGTRARCAQCHGTMVKNPEGIQWAPEFPNSSQNAPSRAGDPRATINDPRSVHASCAESALRAQADAGDWCRFRMNQQCMLPAKLNPAATSEAGYTIFTPQHRGMCNRYTATQQMACPTGMPKLLEPGRQVDPLWVTGARQDTEFAFHFTAAWKDVVAKAKRIREEGGVRVLAVSGEGVVGEVRGDNAVYEATIHYVPGSKKVADWSCGCKWASYAWGRSPAYRRFEGRQCSHVAALRFEVGARGMFGRDVTMDKDQLEGQYQRTPVQVQHLRGTEREPERELRRRTVPPGNMYTRFPHPSLAARSASWIGDHPEEPTLFWRAPNMRYEVHIKNWMPDRNLREQYGAKPTQYVALHYHEDPTNPHMRPSIRSVEKGELGRVDQFGNRPPMPPAHVMKHVQRAVDAVNEHAQNHADLYGQLAEQQDIQHDLDRVPRDMEHEQRAHRMFDNLLRSAEERNEDDDWFRHSSLDVTPAHEWARVMTALGNAPHEILVALKGLGMTHEGARQALSWATAGPESNLVQVDGELHSVVHVDAGNNTVTLADGRTVAADRAMAPNWHPVIGLDPAQAAKKDLYDEEHPDEDEEATADPMGGQAEPGSDIPRLNLRDQTDAKKEDRHILHHTNDARQHAPNFGYGLPWGGSWAWCDQCSGSGCGHCGGTGQVQVDVAPTAAASGAPGDASTTNSAVADQGVDAGDLISGDGLSATGMQVITKSVLDRQAEAFDFGHEQGYAFANSGDESDPDLVAPQVADAWYEQRHRQHVLHGFQHGYHTFLNEEERGLEHKGGSLQAWDDWLDECQNPWCKHPEHMAEREARDRVRNEVHSDPNALHLLDTNPIGPTRYSSLHHTADYTADSFLTGPPAQNYQAPTPHSNSDNPASTGWATSADSPSWEQPIIGHGFGITWDAALHSREEVTCPPESPDVRTAKKEGDPSLPTGEAPTHAGLVLKAADTGRVLMIQRSHQDEKDPARGTWEFPGGGVEDGDDTSLHAAIREWEEEVGQKFPTGGHLTHVWRSGPYVGHVVVIPSESHVDFSDGRSTVNPDDPDGDDHEQSAWWEPEHAKKNPALREECKGSPWGDIKKSATKWTRTIDDVGGGGGLPERPRFVEPQEVGRCRTCGQESSGISDHTERCAECDNIADDRDPKHREPSGGSTHAWWGSDPDKPFPGERHLPLNREWWPEHWDDRLRATSGFDPMDESGYQVMSAAHEARFLTVDEARAAGQQAMEEAGFTDPNAYLRHIYAQQEPDLAWLFLGTLHDEPEPALPSTDGAADDASESAPELEVPADGATGPDMWPDMDSGMRTDRQTAWGYAEQGDHPSDPTTDPDFSPGSADHDMTPGGTDMNLPFRPEASVDPILAQFWSTAGAKALVSDGPSQPQNARAAAMAAASGKRSGSDFSDSDIAAAARAALAKTSAKDFTFAEQQELINEGLSSKARARNFGSLMIKGTHYEHIADEDDDGGYPF